MLQSLTQAKMMVSPQTDSKSRDIFICHFCLSHFLVRRIAPKSVTIDGVEVKSLLDIIG